jgi:hypothetical protein
VAIQLVGARYISGGSSRSAVRPVTYNRRYATAAEHTGDRSCFRDHDTRKFVPKLMADGAADKFQDRTVFSNRRRRLTKGRRAPLGSAVRAASQPWPYC